MVKAREVAEFAKYNTQNRRYILLESTSCCCIAYSKKRIGEADRDFITFGIYGDYPQTIRIERNSKK